MKVAINILAGCMITLTSSLAAAQEAVIPMWNIWANDSYSDESILLYFSSSAIIEVEGISDYIRICQASENWPDERVEPALNQLEKYRTEANNFLSQYSTEERSELIVQSNDLAEKREMMASSTQTMESSVNDGESFTDFCVMLLEDVAMFPDPAAIAYEKNE